MDKLRRSLDDAAAGQSKCTESMATAQLDLEAKEAGLAASHEAMTNDLDGLRCKMETMAQAQSEQGEEDATPRPPAEVGGVDVSGTPLRPERPAALTGNSVVLLLVYLLGMVPLVLTFAGGTHVPAATRPALAGGAVEAAETWATTLVAAPRKLVGYAVGKAASGAKVVAVPVATVSPENIAARRQGASRGGLQLVWCTLALLSGAGPAYSIAALAAARSASFSVFGENTQPLVRADAALQAATGILAGSSEELIAPIPTKWMVLDAPTPRELVPRMAEDIEAFKLDLGQYRGPHEEHVRGWVDSVQPLDLSEVPDDLDRAARSHGQSHRAASAASRG